MCGCIRAQRRADGHHGSSDAADGCCWRDRLPFYRAGFNVVQWTFRVGARVVARGQLSHPGFPPHLAGGIAFTRSQFSGPCTALGLARTASLLLRRRKSPGPERAVAPHRCTSMVIPTRALARPAVALPSQGNWCRSGDSRAARYGVQAEDALPWDEPSSPEHRTDHCCGHSRMTPLASASSGSTGWFDDGRIATGRV